MTCDEKITALKEFISNPDSDPVWVELMQEYHDMIQKEAEGKALFFDKKSKGIHVEF